MLKLKTKNMSITIKLLFMQGGTSIGGAGFQFALINVYPRTKPSEPRTHSE